MAREDRPRARRGMQGPVVRRRIVGGGVALVALGFALAAMPTVAQHSPTSLLPPGFSEAPQAEPASEATPARAPRAPAAPPAAPSRPAGQPLQLDLSGVAQPPAPVAANEAVPAEPDLTPAEIAAQQRKYDLPPKAQRSLDRIGPLTPANGGLEADAFGRESGRYLAAMMRATRAPVVSRWASVLLRRALLSEVRTPADINGADWAAERAWLLVRMGEANSARLMVQSVDNGRYTKRLYAVAMQAYLASADPVGLCPLYQGAEAGSPSPSWLMADAICASFSAEQGRASAILGQTQRRGSVRGVDYRLTEKMVGAGANARRSVSISWNGVERLTAWRFGLASALNVDIPQPLMDRAGSHVLAWQAAAPALAPEKRLAAVEMAARLGVFSSAALVDYYSQLDGNDNAPDGFETNVALLRQAYGGATVAARIGAMRDYWGNGTRDIVRLLALSRAAAVLPASDIGGADLSNLVAAMLSAGYDNSAARWAVARDSLADAKGEDGWAMLAVGAPRMVVEVQADRLRDYIAEDGLKGEMMLAGLAGLGRIGNADFQALAGGAGLILRARGQWERAIDAAATRGEPGTVALLTAVGMQAPDWNRLPPEHLYHIVAALHKVGLDPEARMIAAEAIMRS